LGYFGVSRHRITLAAQLLIHANVGGNMVKRYILILFTLFLFLSGCQEPNIIKVDSDEIEILNCILDNALRPDSLERQFYYSPIILGFQDSIMSISQQRIRDSIKSIYDTLTFYILVNDTMEYYKTDLSSLNEKVLRDNFNENFPEIDQSFIPLINKIVDSTSRNRIVDLSLLRTKYDYKFKSINQKGLHQLKFYVVTEYRFSIVALNQERDMACLYVERRSTSEKLNNHEGSGYILFLQKQNHKWILKGEALQWITQIINNHTTANSVYNQLLGIKPQTLSLWVAPVYLDTESLC
jgi:hypothetical protein